MTKNTNLDLAGLELKTKIAQTRIKEAFQNEGVYLGHSGGKDSAVILHLTLGVLQGAKPVIVHTIKDSFNKNRTHPDTIRYLYDKVSKWAKVMHFVPEAEMENFRQTSGLKYQIDGTRASEFERLDRSSTLVMDGKEQSREHMGDRTKNGVFGFNFFYPIYDWSDQDVWDYIWYHMIPMSREYDNLRPLSPTCRENCREWYEVNEQRHLCSAC